MRIAIDMFMEDEITVLVTKTQDGFTLVREVFK